MAEGKPADRVRKAEEAGELHDRIRAAVAAGRVELFADARMLDFQGSPVHSPWDQLAPLLALMLLALVILLSAGMAFGIVAMTAGVLLHLTATRHLAASRVKKRATAYMLESANHWQALWQLGGVAMVLRGTNEPPCLAPLGDWRKFARRNLPAEGDEASAPPPQQVPAETVPADGA